MEKQQNEELLVDEREVEEELEHLEEQKKRKAQKLRNKRRRRFKRFMTAAIVLLAAAGIIYAVHLKKVKEAAESSTVTVQAGKDEAIVYAKVTSIQGNDISASLMKKTETGRSQEESGSTKSADSGRIRRNRTAGEDSTESQSSVQPAEGNRQMPSGIGNSEMSSGSRYTKTGETKTYEIPVGTAVTTKLGTVTTFSRITASDTLAIVVRKGTDNILRIYIQ